MLVYLLICWSLLRRENSDAAIAPSCEVCTGKFNAAALVSFFSASGTHRDLRDLMNGRGNLLRARACKRAAGGQ